MAYDIQPLVTIEEKEAFLNRAESEEWSLFFEHDAVVEVADLTRSSKGVFTRDERALVDLF